ncbi:Protein CBR-ADM-4 [Caenorhabditis briggsae]|uniref:Protein CBR-ADM-4 n=1 Tax=Caenorhabditis briggsae TaxID=6238 RepID=A8XPT9_CAEBR|nr:Protein CBR-ADM-4 [Caenorhabditis briggsae]CAP34665.2 Protein CBR-ADM-4 [Caenorhabditis briggsae]
MKIHITSIFILLAVGTSPSDAFNTRVKRHAPVIFQKSTRSSIIYFDFLGQEYVIDLIPNHSAFHQKFKVYTQNGPQFVAREEYIGTVREPRKGTGVLTHLENGEYIGILYFDNDTLHLEPAYPHGLSEDVGKIVGYFGSDVDLKLDLAALPHRYQVSFRPSNPLLKHKRAISIASSTSPTTTTTRSDVHNEKRNRCSLKLVADYSFYSIFGKNNTGIVTKFLVNMIARVNEIYNPVNWDVGREEGISGRGRFQNMGFSIKEIKVFDRPNASDAHYNSYSRQWESEKLLKEFAFAEGSKDFCLVHLVTARTFKETSTLGLAYLSHRTWDDTAGGICSKPETFNGKIAYINVLLSTCFANMEQSTYPLITKEIDIVVSHEYGHAWGANHDSTMFSDDPDVDECSPNDQDGGKYLMSPYAQRGYDQNNVLFSPCSIKSIREVLINKYSGCLEEEMNSFCGNGIVEDGEECDNGVETDEQEVSCCDKFCRLSVGAKCSPLNHICCTPTCQFHNSSHVCLPGDPLLCKADALCNGLTGECPPAPPVADQQECLEGGECFNGVCLPFCEKKSIGQKSCICENLEISCRRCCRDQNGTCSPVPGPVYLRDGIRCSKGTCRDRKCVNEAVDNVRNYFLAPFQSTGGLLVFLKTHVVLIAIITISMIFAAAYSIVKCNEHNISKLSEEDRAVPLRKVHVSAEVFNPGYHE